MAAPSKQRGRKWTRLCAVLALLAFGTAIYCHAQRIVPSGVVLTRTRRVSPRALLRSGGKIVVSAASAAHKVLKPVHFSSDLAAPEPAFPPPPPFGERATDSVLAGPSARRPIPFYLLYCSLLL